MYSYTVGVTGIHDAHKPIRRVFGRTTPITMVADTSRTAAITIHRSHVLTIPTARRPWFPSTVYDKRHGHRGRRKRRVKDSDATRAQRFGHAWPVKTSQCAEPRRKAACTHVSLRFILAVFKPVDSIHYGGGDHHSERVEELFHAPKSLHHRSTHASAIADKRTDISHLTGVDRMLYDVVWTYVRRRHHHPLTRVESDSPRTCSLCKERGNICWTCEECHHTLCEPCFYIRYL